MYQEEFDDIRPYHDEEIHAALSRIVAMPEFGNILDFLFPGENKDRITADLKKIHSGLEFQKQFMHPLVCTIVSKTSKGLTTSGFERLSPGTSYLFVANHRDIVLDSAILQVKLLDYGHETSEITFGSNLMSNPFIIDFGKVNRMYKVYRGGNRMELFRSSKVLSSYIRHTITKKHISSWIAQRNGRTKNGCDKTETGLLKMFNISGSEDFFASFKELNIIPLAISYELEPCCAFKIRETSYAASGVPYRKEPHEDFNSIIMGITQPKGRIHLAACTPVNEMLDRIDDSLSLNDKINKLAALIDSEIYSNFRLWPFNYAAHDILTGSNKFAGHYTEKDLSDFSEYIAKELSLFTGDIAPQKELLLKLYANPVIMSSSSAIPCSDTRPAYIGK